MSAGAYGASDERAALAASATRFLHARCARTTPLPHGAPPDPSLWREMAEFGWLATTIAERDGGLGLPLSYASVLSEALAPAAIVEPFASQVARGGGLLAAADPSPLRDATLARWLAGDGLVALAHHELARAAYFDTPVATSATVTSAHTFRLRGRKTQVVDGGLAATYLVSARLRESGNCCLFLCDARAPGLEIHAAHTLDGRHLAVLDFDDVEVSSAARLHFADDTGGAIDDALAGYALLLAAESVGAMRALVALTHAYLEQREQFGRKLVEFQVLQHRLVDMLLALTRGESLLELARVECDARGALAAASLVSAAKAAAGDGGRAVAEEAMQLHGAVGLTADLMVGALARRLAANAILGGTTTEHLARFCAGGNGVGANRH